MWLNVLLNIALILLATGAVLVLPFSKRSKSFGIIAVSFCLLLEIFVCNFHSFHLIKGGYEKCTLSLDNATVSSNRLEGITETTVTFTDLDKKVGTVYLDCTLHETQYNSESNTIKKVATNYLNVTVDAKDETYGSSYRYNTANGVIIRDNDRTNTIVLNMSGKVSDMRITVSSDNGLLFDLNEVKINTPVPFNLSAFRVLLAFCMIFAGYLLLTSETLKKSVGENKKLFAFATVFITVLLLIVAFGITAMYNVNGTGLAVSSFRQTSGNQISQELVDAFEKGQVSLLDTPSEQLLNMDNPYDWGARIKENVSYKWDHLLYEGKYYSYYGIAPVILLFLPYHLLTGFYFPTPEAVLIFGMIGIAFLSMLLYEFIKKLFPKLPLSIAICSLIVIQASSGIWYCFASPLFYEIAQSSGFAFTCAGFYFLLTSNVISAGRIKRWRLCLSSFCLSCAVLCRPTLAVYCIAALLFIAVGFIKNRKQAIADGKNRLSSAVGYLAAALTCFAVIGGCQMIYNYVRFGSILDFGIQYSLTINDFTRAEYHTDFVAIGFWNYLFAAPYIKPEFPFVFSNFSNLDTNGYYFIANRNAVGIIYRAMPVLALLISPLAFKKANKRTRLIPAILISAVCVICPLVIIFSIWESGYGVRYAADFSWQMVIGGMAVLYYLLLKNDLYQNSFANKIFTCFFVFSAFSSLAINGGLMYDYLNKSGHLQSAFLTFERLFEFWI